MIDYKTLLAVVLVLSSLVVVAVATVGSPSPADNHSRPLRFTDVSDRWNFDYESNTFRRMGSSRAGVYVADTNRNGYPDILAVGGDAPALFRNDGTSYEKHRVFSETGETVKSAVFFDHDNDGWEDLVLLPLYGTPILFENERGTFVERDDVLDERTLSVPMSAAAADFNQDGCLDLYVAQNGDWSRRTPKKEAHASGMGNTGALDSVEIQTDNGNPNLLFEGTCGGFEDVTESAGVAGNRWTTATSFVDLTGDGLPDIHTANDFNHDRVFRNEGDGTFEATRIPGTNRNGMSSEIFDVNEDGLMDIFVTNIRIRSNVLKKHVYATISNAGNNLLINRGNGSFESMEYEYGVADGGWGWAAVATDFNNDGSTDLLHATQHLLDSRMLTRLNRSPPRVWSGDGGQFIRENATAIGFGVSDGRGLARLDFNRDGAQDVVIAVDDGSYRLYENQVEGGNWIRVLPRGDSNIRANGARVTIERSAGSSTRIVHSRADFLSQDSRALHFGLGTASKVTLVAHWPDGRVHRFSEVRVNREVTLYPNGTIHQE